jgi:uncharacterized RDD family membrane protein YckC
MNTHSFKILRCWALLVCCMLLTAAQAQDVQAPAAGTTGAAGAVGDGKTTTFEAPSSKADDDDWSSSSDDDTESDDTDSSDRHHRYRRFHGRNNDVVSVGRKAVLAAGEHAGSVVAIFGSATSAGDVDDAVVSVMGSSRITGGKVGNTAVAVMGSVYVNAEVDGDVVAVLGNVELGPEAKVHGDVVVVGGELNQDSNATINGHVDHVLGVEWADFDWVRPWIERCLLYGRPLAFESDLGWAWGIALGLLALYVFMAFVFRSAVDKCVHTLETHAGHSILAALLLTLAIPVLFVLLFITVLGIAAVPFLAIAVVCAAMFGKVVVLAAIGRRCTPMLAKDPTMHTVVGVFVGGLIVTVIYTIPVVGFIVYKLLELLGLGVVVYTLLVSVRASRQARVGGGGAAGGAAGPGGAEAGDGAAPAGAAAASASTADPGVTAGEGFTFRDSRADDTAPPPGPTQPNPPPPGSPPPPPPPPGPPPLGQAPPINLVALPRAGFVIRVAAILLDVILVGIVLHLLHEGSDVELLALGAYGAVMWKLKASTVGGIICGLQVVRLDGRPIDWPTAIVRALGCFLSLAIVGLGFIWIAIDNEKQSWHDKIAGTVVVRAPKGSSLL